MSNFLKKHNRKIFLLTIILLFTTYFFINQIKAATITEFEARISDSRPTQTNVIYDFQGNTTTTAAQCIKVQFCDSANRGAACSAPTGMDASGAATYSTSPYLWNVFTYSDWTISTTSTNAINITHDSGGENGGNDSSWVINGITNPSLAGTYFVWLNTYNNVNCSSSQLDNGITAFAIVPPAEGVSFSLTFGTVNNPVPALGSINPSSKTVGSAGFTMILTGSDFISSSVVRFAGSNRSTTYINPTTLTAEISSSDLLVVGDFNITVFNSLPGGGESSPQVFSVIPTGGGEGNPVPVLTTINPTSKNKGDPGFTMTLTGSDFISSSMVRFAGSNRLTTYLNSNMLQAEILDSDLQVVGNFNITVFNPSPGGGESSPQIFSVIDVGEGNPVPILTSINPSAKIVGDETFTMTLVGSNFISSSVVRFAGSARLTTYINSTTLTAQIPASDLLVAGSFNITVFNPSPGGGESAARILSVNNPLPTLTSINPTWKYVNADAFVMTLTGSDFISSSVVRFAGSARVTTFISRTELEAEILSSDLQIVGNFNVTVFNPSPGGGESSAQTFHVLRLTDNPIPTLGSINPTWRYQNSGAFNMTLTGADFMESSVVHFAGSDRTTTYIDENTLQAYILITDLQILGDFNITVFNSSPGGGESSPKVFSVIRTSDNPVPSLGQINPTWRYLDSSGFTMTLTGSDFISSSVVRFAGSARVTTFISRAELEAEILSSDLQIVGSFNITVFNPSPGGGESSPQVFSVIAQEEEEEPGEGEEEIITPIILEPLDGTYSNKKITTLRGLAQAGKAVDVFVNDQKVKTVYADQNGNFETSLELEENRYFIQVSVQNKRSDGVNLIIDLTPPEPPKLLETKIIEQRLLIGQINFSLLVKGENPIDAASLRIVINPDFTFPTAAGKWEKTVSLSLPAGKHQVYAFVYDLAGNISKPSNVLDFEIGIQIQPPLNIVPPIALVPNLKEVGEIVKKIIDNPQVERAVEDTSRIALPVATVISVGAAASAIASSGFSLFQLLSAIYLIFIQPFSLIFSKKRKRGWSVIYNFLTKQPVDLAVIRLFDAKTNRLLSTKISDREGRFIFIVNPGVYKITANKSEFQFPSKFLASFKEDFQYLNLYHGEEIEVKEKNTVINANIPLDPDKKLKTNEWLVKDYMQFSLKKAIPIAALAMSLLSYFVNPRWYLLIPIFLNLFIYILIRSVGSRVKKDWGIVADQKNKKPLHLAVVRIFESTFDKLVDQQVTNVKGQYGFLAGGGKFYLTYNKSGYLEKTSSPLDFAKQAKGIIVNLDAYLRRLEEKKMIFQLPRQ